MILNDYKIIKNLCYGCGTCAGVCPTGSMTMQKDKLGVFTPSYNGDLCIRCNNCVNVCPATAEYKHHCDIVKQEENLMNPCRKAFVGYTKNDQVRNKATSGGIITTLLDWAIREKIIDSALVVKSKTDDPFSSEATIIFDCPSLYESSGSRYLPVEFSSAIKAIIYNENIKKTAIVGLPCHIHGITLAQSLLPNLNEKIIFKIGLFCKQTKDIRFTDMILAKMKLNKNEVKSIKYRAKGWPGNIVVTLKNEQIKIFPYNYFNMLWGALSCSPKSCLTCTDSMSRYADISVGDAWLPDYINEEQGTSVILARTQTGQKLLNQAITKNKIAIQSIDPTEILKVQPKFIVQAKKENYWSRCKILGLSNKNIKKLYSKKQSSQNFSEAVWVFIVRFFSSSLIFRKLYPYLPNLIHKTINKAHILIWEKLAKRNQ